MIDNSKTANSFLKELCALLEKYNIELYTTLYDGIDIWKDDVLLVSEFMTLTPTKIKEYLK